ncbi:hypothetical protein [Xanthomonas arboricola]|uniref:hypothetical protein n=1 Tax=Xanthomonas arboricola TaxID=56448 RepID=UPI0013E0A564|nr:hypothetical protein [Xanthomonas arboricola]
MMAATMPIAASPLNQEVPDHGQGNSEARNWRYSLQARCNRCRSNTLTVMSGGTVAIGCNRGKHPIRDQKADG